MVRRFAPLGPVCAVIGAQWGDEGKGKIVDLLAGDFDVIARASGGANAGHTIVVNGTKHVFHLIPSGCLHEGKDIVLGAGMVIHLPTLLEEIAVLARAGISVVHRLVISHAAHILFDFHKEIDAALEEERSKMLGKGIGTTRRGIGPAYMDKAARRGIRMESLRGSFEDAVRSAALTQQQRYFISIDPEKEIGHMTAAAELLKDRIVDCSEFLGEAMAKNRTILIEGAQAVLLDIDHGTYPYVTSSSTTAAGALQGLGLPPRALTSCIGVAKAYCTRVGEGEFLTEAQGETAERLRKRGGEYGATTGRPRRCGWLHLPDLLRAARISGFTHWNITKLDVLDEEKEIPVGVGQEQGRVLTKNFPGWQTSVSAVTDFAKLPKAAQHFIGFLEKETGVPAGFIGTGPNREDMIVRV